MQSPLLIHILSTNRWSGVSRYALDICTHFHNNGWDVAVVTRDAKVVDKPFEKEGIRLLHAPFRGMFDYRSLLFLTRLFKQNSGRPIVLHVHGFRNACTALLARRLARRHDIREVMTRHKVRKGIDTWLFRKIYGKLDAIIFVSRLACHRFLSTWHDIPYPFPEEKLHVIHNSLLHTPENPAPRQQKGPVIAMYHGQLKPGRGLEDLIDALSLLKNSRLRLRIDGKGNPDYLDRLRRRAQTRGVMEMIDWQRNADNSLALILDSDFGVLPSRIEEAFGLSNLRFMACRRPQVCTSNGAQPEYITDGAEGFLVSPGNPAVLAEAMKRLVADSELRMEMGRRARKTFEDSLSWETFADRLSKIYLNS